MMPSARYTRRPPQDCLEFLNGYPNQRLRPAASKNLEFYTGRLKAQPDNLDVGGMHRLLEGNWEECEANHGWVQWLFPIRAQGVNSFAQPLQPHEIEALLVNPEFPPLLQKSTDIFLNFLGIQQVNPQTGECVRVSSGFDARTNNFRRRSHNLLRITRFLKSMSEFKKEEWSDGFLLFLLSERRSYGWEDPSNPFKRSLSDYYVWCFRDEMRRKRIMEVLVDVMDGKRFERAEYKAIYH